MKTVQLFCIIINALIYILSFFFFFNRVCALDLLSLLSKRKWVWCKRGSGFFMCCNFGTVEINVHDKKHQYIFAVHMSTIDICLYIVCYFSHSVTILQYDFTMWGGLLFVFLIILILFGLFAAIFHNKVRTKYLRTDLICNKSYYAYMVLIQ